jgi:cell division protein FtsQ
MSAAQGTATPGAGAPGAGAPGAGAPESGASESGASESGASEAARSAAASGGGDPWRAAFFVVAAAAIVAGVAWALLGSSLLVVRSIQVTGTHLVSRAEVLRAARIEPGTPLIRLDTAAVARRIEQITQVQSARVTRDWPDTVVIAVRERTPALAVASGGRFDLIDKFGVMVRQTAHRPRLLPLFADPPGVSLRGSPEVRAAAMVLRQLPRRVRRAVRAVEAPSAAAITLRLRGGITVAWGGTGRGPMKARELEILMRTKARYYNVSGPAVAVTGG